MTTADTEDSIPLLATDEPAAFELFNVEGKGNAVLVCDHAANRVPRHLHKLGLDDVRLADHIAWDPGAAAVARQLAAHLDAPLVLSAYSRLVIDCNRPLHSPQSIAEKSAGVTVPGNLALSQNARQARIDAVFRPYHDAIERLLDRRGGQPTLFISVHSFTPILDGEPRPWHIGISWYRDRRFARLLFDELARSGDLIVGDNQPYPIEEVFDYTIPEHGARRGLPSVMIEIRQDGIRTEASVQAWAARLARACQRIEAAALATGRA